MQYISEVVDILMIMPRQVRTVQMLHNTAQVARRRLSASVEGIPVLQQRHVDNSVQSHQSQIKKNTSCCWGARSDKKAKKNTGGKVSQALELISPTYAGGFHVSGIDVMEHSDSILNSS